MHTGLMIRGVCVDLYAPALVLSRRGVEISAPCSITATLDKKGWAWVVGIRVLGFGAALSKKI